MGSPEKNRVKIGVWVKVWRQVGRSDPGESQGREERG